ncbi:TlpA disulfide reductase family protein [Alkalihalobacillus sp. FSL R5-0424]
MKRKLTIFIFIIAICIGAGLLINQLVNGSKQVGTQEGMQTESIHLKTTDGQTADVFEPKNRVTVLNVWATWCEPCVRELPALMELESDYNQKGVDVITLNAQKFERVPEHTFEFMEEQQLTLPVFLDSEGEFFDTYSVQGLPTTFIVDADQTIVKRIEGEVHYEMIQEMIEPLLPPS